MSAAFFLSIEFQETGLSGLQDVQGGLWQLAERARAVTYGEFLPDSQQIALGVEVGIGDWQTALENNKVLSQMTLLTARASVLHTRRR